MAGEKPAYLGERLATRARGHLRSIRACDGGSQVHSLVLLLSGPQPRSPMISITGQISAFSDKDSCLTPG